MHDSVTEHWQLKPEVSWVQLLVTAGLFTFGALFGDTSSVTSLGGESLSIPSPPLTISALGPQTLCPEKKRRGRKRGGIEGRERGEGEKERSREGEERRRGKEVEEERSAGLEELMDGAGMYGFGRLSLWISPFPVL